MKPVVLDQPLKTKIQPENRWLGKTSSVPSGNGLFSGFFAANFRECMCIDMKVWKIMLLKVQVVW